MFVCWGGFEVVFGKWALGTILGSAISSNWCLSSTFYVLCGLGFPRSGIWHRGGNTSLTWTRSGYLSPDLSSVTPIPNSPQLPHPGCSNDKSTYTTVLRPVSSHCVTIQLLQWVTHISEYLCNKWLLKYWFGAGVPPWKCMYDLNFIDIDKMLFRKYHVKKNIFLFLFIILLIYMKWWWILSKFTVAIILS